MNIGIRIKPVMIFWVGEGLPDEISIMTFPVQFQSMGIEYIVMAMGIPASPNKVAQRGILEGVTVSLRLYSCLIGPYSGVTYCTKGRSLE